MENNPRKAVIYCRVSTKEQVDDGNSLVTQEKNCRDYAIKNGYQITEVFVEMGESAKTADRTELKKLFIYCANKQNNVSAVIAYKIDRISRNTDDYSQIRLLLKKYGVEIKSTSEYFENTPAGRFMENIIANVAQFDNDVRAERCIGGMKQAVSEGRYVWTAPMGYKNAKVNGKSTIVPDEKAEVVRFIFEQIANKTMTAEAVRQHLFYKRNISISKSRFYVLLGNNLYTGKITKFGQTFNGAFEPIISEALFNLAQQVLFRKYSNRQYKIENADFPLRRFIMSPSGHYLTGCWCQGNRNKYPYYRLPGNGKMIRKNKLEDAFVSYLNTFSIGENILHDLKERCTMKLRDTADLKEIFMERLAIAEAKLKEKRSSLVEKNLRGVISDDILKEQLERINAELWQTQNTLSKNQDKIIDLNFIFSRLTEMLRNPGNFWDAQPFHIKRKLQKFEFPEGLVLQGNNFQTKKVCSFFKLKSTIISDLSLLVDYSGNLKKQQYFANSSPLQDAELMVLLQTIQSDLVIIDEILKPPE